MGTLVGIVMFAAILFFPVVIVFGSAFPKLAERIPERWLLPVSAAASLLIATFFVLDPIKVKASCEDKLKQLETARREASAATAREFFECKALSVEFGSAGGAIVADCLETARALRDINSRVIADIDRRMMDPDIRACRP